MRIVRNDNYNNQTQQEYQEGALKKTFAVHDLRSIHPKTHSQKDAFQHFFQGNHIVLSGHAGTGKTFLSLYLALQEVLDPESTYERVVIVRSVVPVRDIGFLPGTADEKISVYEDPYRAICDELFPWKKSYDNMKRSGYIEFVPTSFVRGVTLDNCIVVFDEASNANFQEIDSVLTRLGRNAKIMLCGDVRQSDLVNRKGESEGFTRAMDILSRMDNVGIVQFTAQDIVRSGFVRNYLITKEDLGY